MRETLISKVIDYLAENPTATNAEIASDLGAGENVIKTYIGRLNRQSKITTGIGPDGKRHIRVLEVPKDFKREVYEMMVEKYLEDFDNAEFYTERIEIGKLILRLMEKL